MVRWASSSTVPGRPAGTVSNWVAPAEDFSVGLSISHAYSVGIGPGAMALTRMLYLAHSTPNDIVIAFTAAFPIADGTTNAEPVQIHVVNVDSTFPGKPCSIQRFPAACVT